MLDRVQLATPALYVVTPNQGGLFKPRRVILHSTGSGADEAREFKRTVSYFSQPGNPSSHRVIGYERGQHAMLVPDDRQAWHAREDNESAWGIEFGDADSKGPYSDWQLESGAAVVASWFLACGIEPTRETIVRHRDTAQGKREGKVDPGDCLPLDWFIEEVRRLMYGPEAFYMEWVR